MNNPHAPPDHPGSRRITVMPSLPNNGSKSSPFSSTQGAPKFAIYVATVAAGVEDTFHTDFMVEKWLIAVLPAASVRVNVVAGSSAAGPAMPFGGGGSAKIPGDGPDLAFRNTGSNPLTIVGIAIVGYDWVDYDPGDLA